MKNSVVDQPELTNCLFNVLQVIKRRHSNSLPPGFGNLSANGEKTNDHVDPISNHFIQEIISSTPELGHFEGYLDSR